MRVVLATGGMAPEPGGVPLPTAAGALPPRAVASALASGWREARPADELVVAPLSDGGVGMLDTLPDSAVLARHELAGTGPLGQPRAAVLAELAGWPAGQEGPSRSSGRADEPSGLERPGRTWLLDAASLLALPADPTQAASEALEGSTAAFGQVLRAALALTCEGDTLVIGLGRAAVHDGGAGMLEGLGGPAQAVELARGRELVLALADTAALSGLGGAGQALTEVAALTPAQAQEADRRASAAASSALAAIEQARQEAGGPSQPAVTVLSADGAGEGRLSVTSWGTGAGGGSAAVLRALGARALPGARVMADLTGLADQVSLASGADLVVTAAGEVYDVLADSVPAVVGELATAQALPAVLVCRQGLVPRGELAEAGLSAVYSLADSPSPATGAGEAGAEPWDGVVAGLEDLGARLARTWSR